MNRIKRNEKQRKLIALLMIIMVTCTHLSVGQQTDGINFKETSHYFGVFKRDNGLKTHGFEFSNSGKEPLIIKRVKTSCGCTVSEWPKEPIPPGGKGQVVLSFNPQNFSGYFSKSASVYTNRSGEAINLQVSGRILVNQKVNDEFAYFIGDLKADKEMVDFGEVEVGSPKLVQEVRLINIMRDTIGFYVGQAPNGVTVAQSREVIEPGGNCKLSLTFDPSARHNEWGTLDDFLALTVKRSVKTEQRKLPIKIALTDRFSDKRETGKEQAAKLELSNSGLIMLEPNKTEKWQTAKLEYHNGGESDLIIRKLETGSKNIKIKKFDERIGPNKSGKIVLEYMLDKPGVEQLIIWNNSPDNYRAVASIEVSEVK